MGKNAAWSVSSCKPGDNLDTYWQWFATTCDQHSIPEESEITAGRELYTSPSKISIRAGDGFHNLKDIHFVKTTPQRERYSYPPHQSLRP
ncbi:anaphase-promoting complex subunit 10-like [Raphanus sativus]|uniref:Anaphase-promoting complex subunit 10-like n=1 Tax=Raphanus sativus TaxID=3726 RepID=A0A9W3C1L1_RAPSA|nr:anaphase-promoting complex subunit 10-like [Raphanus sativus]